VSFLNLWALWIAAAVVPALLILYFLKLRRREQPVSSTLLWKRALHDLQVNAPFQRLRKSLLLLLQLLVLAAAILALARPIVETSAAAEGRLVILIDRSASMNTVEEGGTRLDEAKEQAVRLVRVLNRRGESWLSFLRLRGAQARTQAMVIAFSDRAAVIAPFTPNTAELVDVIRAIEPTDGQSRIREALELAEAYTAPPTMLTDQTPVGTEDAARVALFSDGRIADLEEAVLRRGRLELVKIGQTRDNVGITALVAERSYERPEVVNVLLEVENFCDEPVTVSVALYIDGQLSDARVRSIELSAAADGDAGQPAGDEAARPGPGARRGLSFELILERGALLEARLSRTDALDVDNRAYAVVPPPRRQRVLVVTENNFFLDSVLAGLPLQERVFITPGQYAAGGGEYVRDERSTFDVVIFDKCSPAALPIGNFLFLKAVPPGDDVQVSAPLDDLHVPVWWDEAHPILRHVPLDYVYVARGLVLRAPDEAEVLIEGPQGPLLLRHARGGRHCLVLSFAVEDSTWWQRASFPVFAYNAIRFLGGGGVTERERVRPGDTLRVVLPEGVPEARLYAPDGSTATIVPDASGTSFFNGTRRAGVYQVRYRHAGEQRTDYYAVNLTDARESDVRPRGADELGTPGIAAGHAIETATPEIWRWFVGAALLILLFEWYVYNRRVMI
jgi:hypothetical protein